MPRVRCEKCRSIARTLYIREIEKHEHEFDPNDVSYKARYVPVGYFCEHCSTIRLNGEFYKREQLAVRIIRC